MAKYNFWIGAWKWLKNTSVVVGLPALMFLSNNYTEWVPEDYLVPVSIILSGISYLTKNRIEFNKK